MYRQGIWAETPEELIRLRSEIEYLKTENEVIRKIDVVAEISEQQLHFRNGRQMFPSLISPLDRVKFLTAINIEKCLEKV